MPLCSPWVYVPEYAAEHLRRWGWLALSVAGIAIADASAGVLAQLTDQIAAIWLANGVVATALLRNPTSEWKRLYLCAYIALVGGELFLGNSPADAVALSLCNMVEILIVTVPLRYFGLDAEFNRPMHLIVFYALALGPATLTSTVLACGYFYASQGVPFDALFVARYASAAVGLSIIVPICVSMQWRDSVFLLDPRKLVGNVLLLLLMAAALAAMREFRSLPLGFILFPVFLCFTVLRGYPGIAIAAILTCIATVLNLRASSGYLSVTPMQVREKLVVLQSFIGVLSVTSIFFASILMERRKLIERLKEMTAAALTAKETAEHSNLAKSDFLAGMSHELRTPLNAILGYSEIMKDGLLKHKCEGECREHSKVIFGAGTHLLSLINDILDMSKIEAGKFELHLEEMDLKAVVNDCAGLMDVKLLQGGLKLKFDLPASPVSLHADGRAVRQILLNLLSNAVKFTPPGGTVTVSVLMHPDCVRLVVRDTGIGIAAKDLPRLGIPFEQIRRSANVSHSGTGLGLALVSALAQKHGGCMKIESEEGTGTAVAITLPRTSAFGMTGVSVAAE